MRKLIPSLNYALLVFLTVSQLAAQEHEVDRSQEQQLDRVEPPFWWSGMTHPTLELMLYGHAIAGLEPLVRHPEVEITAIRRTDNPNYLFVELDLSRVEGDATVPIQLRRDESGTAIVFSYQLHQRQSDSTDRVGFNSSDVIYLLVPDRFANGDTANDNLPGMREAADRGNPDGRHGGDIAGMLKALPYLADMGFTAVWPTPMTENNQPDYSYHGYSATDLYRIDPRFGTNDEFRDLVAEARNNGLKFIQDIIVNHIGDQHPWMQDPPAADWINFPQGDALGRFVPTNHNRSTIQDPYASDYDSKRFTDGWFVPSMPDLNQRNPQLANYLIQNSIWWIEFAGLSGIREDTYSYADKSFLTEWGRRIMLEYPHFNIVGEEWSTNPLIVSYWQRRKQNHDGYVSHTPSMLDFPLYDALLKGLVEPEGWNSGWIRLYEALGNDHVYADPFSLVVFEGNHDTARLFAMLNEDIDLFRMALIFLTTTRGIPQLLYGSELAMSSPSHRADGLVRADYPGGWAGDEINAFTGEGLSALQSSTQAFVRTLLNWRKTSPAIHEGTLKHFAPFDDCYAFFRTHPQRSVMVIFNKSHDSRKIELARFDEVLQRPVQALNPLTGESVTLDSELTLPPRSSLLLQWEQQ